ncbi:MAG: WD40 repeat domain-containing protein [Acetanaerobacterium sp.]
MVISGNLVGGSSGSGGFPDGWKDERTAEAYEDITQGDPILLQHFGDYSAGAIGKVPDPDVLPVSRTTTLAWAPDDTYLATAYSAYLAIYKRNGDILTKLPNPDVLPAATLADLAWSPDGLYLAIATFDTVDRLFIYKRTGDVFAKLPSPEYQLSGDARAVDFSPDGKYLMVGGDGSSVGGMMVTYTYENDVFTRVANPSIINYSDADYVSRIYFLGGNRVIIVLHGINRAFLFSYDEEGFASIQTLYSPAGSAYPILAVSSTSDGQYLFLGSTYYNSKSMALYKWSGSDYDSVQELTRGSNIIRASTFTADGLHLVISHSELSCLTLYSLENDALIIQPYPFSPIPMAYCSDLAESHNGGYLACAVYTTTQPSILVYRLEAKDVATKISTLHSQPVYWLPAADMGVAMESKVTGEQCKINLFPALNNLIGG